MIAPEWGWDTDPRHLVFSLSRYKFVAKMLSGKGRVLEVGCGDGFATRIVCQEVGFVYGVDIQQFEWVPHGNAAYTIHNMTSGPAPTNPCDAAYALDVIEHIPKEQEQTFVDNIAKSLKGRAVCIIGTPSQASMGYASQASVAGHVNMFTAERLKALMQTRFPNVFMFSMNDEVVHTGHYGMAHYLIAMGVL